MLLGTVGHNRCLRARVQSTAHSLSSSRTTPVFRWASNVTSKQPGDHASIHRIGLNSSTTDAFTRAKALSPSCRDGQSATLEYDGTLSTQLAGHALSISASCNAKANMAGDLLVPFMTLARLSHCQSIGWFCDCVLHSVTSCKNPLKLLACAIRLHI